MRPRARRLPGLCLLALLGACGREAETLPAEIRAAVARAQAFVAARQSEDGAWRSETYGSLRDGPSLTPPALKLLLFFPSAGEHDAAFRAGMDYLAGFAGADGRIEANAGFIYPVYTAALATILFTRGAGASRRDARGAWLDFLRANQLTEEQGWGPEDPPYGGWGYALSPPRKGAVDLYDADLSSTLFALGALAVAEVPPDDPALLRAPRFVERCQNWPAEGADPDPRFDDGGFFFTPTNALQNKAGIAGTDAAGRLRYSSYGSMTADGLRALLRCGHGPESPRVQAALRWLGEHFTVSTNPGDYEPSREIERDAAYYYYCWSLAHALRLLEASEIQTPDGPVAWAPLLARELLDRQREDGSWKNPFTMMKEDDPLIATSLAAAALAICDRALRGEWGF